ncbi:hypothetical protein DRW03_25295 [Corallococcus sp. H22C18031201]|nr:hypothetical protein DRW03_25295 [Corallococcus sp. H22C18031201]
MRGGTLLALLVLTGGCGGIDWRELGLRGAVMTRLEPEPAGTHCAQGGHAVFAGVDLDGDGALSEAEVTSLEYLCNATVPGVLVRVELERPGARCPHGGHITRAGADANADGLLDDAEVTREAVICTEPRAVLTRSHTGVADPHCPEGGTSVEAGEDRDGDGRLADVEVEASSVVCAASSAVVTRLDDEPEPSSRCATGGTRVLAGVDADGDGELDDNEVSATVSICKPRTPVSTFDGEALVRNPADVAALQGVQRIRGNLSMTFTELPSLSLPNLEVVEGSVLIHGNPQLRTVETGRLVSVRDTLRVSRNGALLRLVLGSTSPDVVLRVGGAFELKENPALRALAEVGCLRPQSLVVADNLALESLSGLSCIQNLAALTVTGNARLPVVDLPSLFGVLGDVLIADNAALLTLTSAPLVTLGGALTVRNNPLLTSLAGLESLQSAGNIDVSENAGLTSTRGLDSLLHVTDSLSFSLNPKLESVGHLPSLLWVGERFSVLGNVAVRRVEYLPALRSLGSLQVIGNPVLEAMPALRDVLRLDECLVLENAALGSLEDLGALHDVRILVVADNPALTRLRLDALSRVSLGFHVRTNPRLPTCLATALAQATFTGEADRLGIEGNDDSATCASAP